MDLSALIEDDCGIPLSQIRANAQRENVYSSEDGDAVQELKRKIAMCAREGRVPEWFNFLRE